MTADLPAPTRRWRLPLLLLPVAALAVAVVLWFCFPSPEARSFRWGGDASGGEPYLIDRPGQEPGGFEGEIALYLAGQLGLPPQFVQRNWAQMPQDLARKDLDVILNGYEWFPSREQVMTSTIPYFAYRLQLLVRKDSPLRDWKDLRRPGRPKPRVGVLRDSAAQRYLEEHYADDVEIEGYDEEGVTGVMLKVDDGSLAASVQDAPASSWYLRRPEFARLHAVGEPIKPTNHNYYVAFVRKGDDELKRKLDDAIREGLQDGTFRRIFEKYGLWDVEQAGLLEVGRQWPPSETAPTPSLGWFAGQLARASLTTIALALLSFPLAMLLGLLVAVGRLYGPRWLGWPLAAYVELVRGTPLLLQLSVIYYFLPAVGVTLSAFWAGLLGLAVNYAAYEAEIYRAGLLAIPRGQMEAALSLGMRPATALWRILVPQAFRLVVPPVTNDFIALFKDTSVCAVFAVTELTARYRNLAVNNPGLILELGLMTAVLYLLMSYPLSLLARRLERQQQGVTAWGVAMIEVRDLKKRHGPLQVLRGVSLTVRQGEVAAVIGPSGGGKSTLLRCINGLEPFEDGSVQIRELTLRPGRTPSELLRSLRTRVGMVFQQFHLFPHLSVLDNVLSGPLWAQGRRRDQAEPEALALLDRVGLRDKVVARPEQLSGGQQQRVAIARALAVHPEAVLFDEPTSALDPRMAGEVLAVMADLAQAGQTMIVVTHAMSFARKVAHTVHVMSEGTVAESGPPAQVFEAPQTDVTRRFLHDHS